VRKVEVGQVWETDNGQSDEPLMTFLVLRAEVETDTVTGETLHGYRLLDLETGKVDWVYGRALELTLEERRLEVNAPYYVRWERVA
jgi:hypothetical protein